MKISKLFILLALFILLSINVFCAEGIIDNQNLPALKTGNYQTVNPKYKYGIKNCKAVRIHSSPSKSFYGPYVYDDYIVWKNSEGFFLWSKKQGVNKLTFNINDTLLDLNDNKILYRTNSGFQLYNIVDKTDTEVAFPTTFGALTSYDNGEFSYNFDKKQYFLSANIARQLIELKDNSWFSKSSIHEGKTVWSDKDSLEKHQIYYWKGKNEIIQVTNSEKNYYPDIFDGKVVWERTVKGHGVIFYFDGKQIIQISNENFYSRSPKIYNDKIVWLSSKPGKHSNIFYWNGKEILQITDNEYENLNPDIYRDRIAWVQRETNGNFKDVATCVIEEDSIIQIPDKGNVYNYSFVGDSVLSGNPSTAKPFAVGNISEGFLNLKVGLYPFDKPVDIYLAISLDKMGNKLFFIDYSNKLKEFVTVWKKNHMERISNISLFGDIELDQLPKGTYTLYLLVVPAGATDMNKSYLWMTKLVINK